MFHPFPSFSYCTDRVLLCLGNQVPQRGLFSESLRKALKLDQIRLHPAFVLMNPADAWLLLHIQNLSLWLIWKCKTSPSYVNYVYRTVLLTMFAFPGTASTPYKHPIHTWYDQLCSKNHVRNCWKHQIFSPSVVNTLKPTNLCRHSWDYWNLQDFKVPSQWSPSSMNQIFNWAGGDNFNYSVSIPFTKISPLIHLCRWLDVE